MFHVIAGAWLAAVIVNAVVTVVRGVPVFVMWAVGWVPRTVRDLVAPPDAPTFFSAVGGVVLMAVSAYILVVFIAFIADSCRRASKSVAEARAAAKVPVAWTDEEDNDE